jgi:hypothetical protein
MNIEDRKKVVTWLEEQVAKIKKSGTYENPDIKTRTARLEMAIEKEKAVIEAIESAPDFVD